MPTPTLHDHRGDGEDRNPDPRTCDTARCPRIRRADDLQVNDTALKAAIAGTSLTFTLGRGLY